MQLYVISRPSIDWSAVAAFLADHNTAWRRTPHATEADELVELSGRLCYFSFGEHQSARTNPEYIANLIVRGHESVLEHAAWTFIITGVSRAFTHQLVRHRVGISFSQLSQQYYDETDADFVVPVELQQNPKLQAVWRASIQNSLEAYRALLSQLEAEATTSVTASGSTPNPLEVRRAIRSAARSVLPNATETKIAVTANARALRHFLKLRGGVIGDLEMRIVAADILSEVSKDAPALFADLYSETLADGAPIVRERGL